MEIDSSESYYVTSVNRPNQLALCTWSADRTACSNGGWIEYTSSGPAHCPELEGRTNILPLGAFCYQHGRSQFPSSLTGACTDYYVSSTGVAGGNRLCEVNPSNGRCRSGDIIQCSNTPPLPPLPLAPGAATASPPPSLSPPPPSLSPPPAPVDFATYTAGRSNLIPLGTRSLFLA